jgi:hypothetical protein
MANQKPKPILTEALKQTVTDGRRFKTLSLVLESQTLCAKELIRLGVSPQTMSFLALAMERISEELDEAAKYAKVQEEFKKITDGFNPEGGNDKV